MVQTSSSIEKLIECALAVLDQAHLSRILVYHSTVMSTFTREIQDLVHARKAHVPTVLMMEKDVLSVYLSSDSSWEPASHSIENYMIVSYLRTL